MTTIPKNHDELTVIQNEGDKLNLLRLSRTGSGR